VRPRRRVRLVSARVRQASARVLMPASRRVCAIAAVVWRRWRSLGGVIVALALLCLTVVEQQTITDWALHHPYFAVSEIIVSPTHRVREGALLQWMGLRPGVSIWSLAPRALERRLEEHPWIRRARVRRELPHRLIVEVVERQAAAVLLIDELYYVDRSGAVFARVGADESLDLPLVTGIEAAVVNGERPYPRHAVRQALRLGQLMATSGLPFRVSEVHIERDQGITVFPVEPQVAVEFGWGRFPEKLARLGEVLGGFAGREGQLREIDLTYESQVVIRLRQGGGGGRHARA